MMNTQIKIFDNEQFGQIRVAANENNEPLFCLADVCKVLDLDSSQVVKRLGDGVLSIHPTLDSLGRTQNANFVNEDGLYDVILDSRKPEAKQFRKWVTGEVLPSIRKHGAYMTLETLENALLNPDILIQLATSLKQEQLKRITLEREKYKLEQQNASMKPKAELADKILDCDQKIDIGQAAKILGLPFGRNTLFAKLREKGVFFTNRNEPKQEYVSRGYFELKEKWIDRQSHDSFMIIKVLVTQKGLDFIAKLFEIVSSNKQMAKID